VGISCKKQIRKNATKKLANKQLNKQNKRATGTTNKTKTIITTKNSAKFGV